MTGSVTAARITANTNGITTLRIEPNPSRITNTRAITPSADQLATPQVRNRASFRCAEESLNIRSDHQDFPWNTTLVWQRLNQWESEFELVSQTA